MGNILGKAPPNNDDQRLRLVEVHADALLKGMPTDKPFFTPFIELQNEKSVPDEGVRLLLLGYTEQVDVFLAKYNYATPNAGGGSYTWKWTSAGLKAREDGHSVYQDYLRNLAADRANRMAKYKPKSRIAKVLDSKGFRFVMEIIGAIGTLLSLNEIFKLFSKKP